MVAMPLDSLSAYKATPSDTLVSGPEVFLIACGWAVFAIMSFICLIFAVHLIHWVAK